MTQLAEPLHRALLAITHRFGNAGIEFQVGGSLLLWLSGLDAAVGDIDVIVAADARSRVEAALHDLPIEQPPETEPWRTAWFLRATMPTRAGDAEVDVMGGLAMLIDGTLVRFPESPASTVLFEGTEVPLAALADWYHIYRIHNPGKAAVIASRLSDEDIMAAAHRLSIGERFSPTLIVRIGNGS